MSNEPGTYDNTTLESKLMEYLSTNLYSSQRMRDYFLPLLIEKEQITRDQLRKDFVRLKAAPRTRAKLATFSFISVQLGHRWRDYLRQIVSYEYPNHPWEKDNFKIREGYKELVRWSTGPTQEGNHITNRCSRLRGRLLALRPLIRKELRSLVVVGGAAQLYVSPHFSYLSHFRWSETKRAVVHVTRAGRPLRGMGLLNVVCRRSFSFHAPLHDVFAFSGADLSLDFSAVPPLLQLQFNNGGAK